MFQVDGSDILRFVAGAAALALLGLTEFALALFAAYGSIGSAICAYVVPIVFGVRTPRALSFSVLSAAILALIPSLSIAYQLSQPTTASVARACCRDGQWYDILPLTPSQVALNSSAIGTALFVGVLGALFLWKRVAMTRPLPAALAA